MSLVLLDGAMGSELARRGVALPAREWSAHALEVGPEVVAAIHRDYAAAGAEVHTANTFRTLRRRLGDAWKARAREAVALARAAVPPGRRVAGSMGPLEDCYRPDLSPGSAGRAEHREVARVLADAGVDLLLCETFPGAEEAWVAVEEAVATGKETWVALTAGPEATLLTPDALAAALARCVAAGAKAALVNCVNATKTLPYVQAIAALGVPFGAYANAWGGDPDPAAYAALAAEWIRTGATIVGGCCGAGPEHVARLAALRTASTARAPSPAPARTSR